MTTSEIAAKAGLNTADAAVQRIHGWIVHDAIGDAIQVGRALGWACSGGGGASGPAATHSGRSAVR
jgi:hypothetical protein